MKFKWDITTKKNEIGGRQGWAYICNSMAFEVIKIDCDTKSEYEDYIPYDTKVRVARQYKDGTISTIETGIAYCADKDEFILGCGCIGISSRFSFYDMMELIDNANLPVVHENQVIALGKYSKRLGMAQLHLYKVGNVDTHCSTVAKLIPLNDEEMADVVKNAERWCDR